MQRPEPRMREATQVIIRLSGAQCEYVLMALTEKLQCLKNYMVHEQSMEVPSLFTPFCTRFYVIHLHRIPALQKQ